MGYKISCKMIRNGQVCDCGWHVGDEVIYDPETCKLDLPHGRVCTYTLTHLLELIIILSNYVPPWALYDDEGEPYLPYRCRSIAPVWWEVRRVGGEAKRGLCGLTPEEKERKARMLKDYFKSRDWIEFK